MSQSKWIWNMEAVIPILLKLVEIIVLVSEGKLLLN